MSVTLSLPGYRSEPISKDRILDVFSDTVLGSALQLDPDVANIELTEPSLTPIQLDYFATLIQSQTLFAPHSGDYSSLYRYFGGKLLQLVTDPRFRDLPKVDLLDSKVLRDNYQTLIEYAMRLEWPELPTSNEISLIDDGVFWSELYGKLILTRPQFQRYFLGRLGPDFWYLRNDIARVADPTTVKQLWSDWIPKHPHISDINSFIITLIQSEKKSVDLLKFILEDSNLPASVDWYQFLETAIDYGTPEQVHYLLTRSEIDPTVNNYHYIKHALMSGRRNILLLLLENPRIDPNFDGYFLLRTARRDDNQTLSEMIALLQRVTPFLETIRLTLDHLRLPDVEPILAWFDEKVGIPYGSSRDYEKREMPRSIQGLNGTKYYTIKRRGETDPIGFIFTIPNPGHVHLGYAMNPEYQGQGYMTEAVRGYLASLPADTEVVTWIKKTNPASIHVALKSGLILDTTKEDYDRYYFVKWGVPNSLIINVVSELTSGKTVNLFDINSRLLE